MDYSDKITELIPEATKLATEKMKRRHGKKYETRFGYGGRPYKFCFWTQFFHQEMNKLAYEKGLRPWK